MPRISKIIADSGICSRRRAEELILSGQVKVDGITLQTPAVNFEAGKTDIEVAGKIISEAIVTPRLWLYHKPVGLIVSHSDPQNRPTVFDELQSLPRVISVGRLDINSEGLLILTNSGMLARTMELPKTSLSRTYKVRAYGHFNIIELQKIELGINISGIFYKAQSIKLLQKTGMNAWFEVVLQEGKNREIRKIFDFFELKVNRLIRTSYGPFELGDLEINKYQEQPLSSFKNLLRNENDKKL